MIRRLPLVTLALLARTATAWAATDPHADHHGIPWSTLFFSAVNFSLFLFLLYRTALPAVRNWAIARRDRIVDELEQAARARAEAEALKAEWERRMERMEHELAGIRDQALADAQRERERILQAAQATAAAIAADAERAAAQELRKAIADLRAQVAREAVATAGEVLRDRLTEADQNRFVEDFLREVRI
jgi:F-type H+-transporting ATPase subunit b